MKYLLISDIHGCLPALERALHFYKEQHCDMLCILGDIINYGPRNQLPEGLNPKGIVEQLNAMADDVVAIRGNCDSEVGVVCNLGSITFPKGGNPPTFATYEDGVISVYQTDGTLLQTMNLNE